MWYTLCNLKKADLSAKLIKTNPVSGPYIEPSKHLHFILLF